MTQTMKKTTIEIIKMEDDYYQINVCEDGKIVYCETDFYCNLMYQCEKFASYRQVIDIIEGRD